MNSGFHLHGSIRCSSFGLVLGLRDNHLTKPFRSAVAASHPFIVFCEVALCLVDNQQPAGLKISIQKCPFSPLVGVLSQNEIKDKQDKMTD